MAMVSIAAVGCVHGELDAMYSAVQDYEAKHQVEIDLVLCCGTSSVSGMKLICRPWLAPTNTDT